MLDILEIYDAIYSYVGKIHGPITFPGTAPRALTFASAPGAGARPWKAPSHGPAPEAAAAAYETGVSSMN